MWCNDPTQIPSLVRGLAFPTVCLSLSVVFCDNMHVTVTVVRAVGWRHVGVTLSTSNCLIEVVTKGGREATAKQSAMDEHSQPGIEGLSSCQLEH